jgi:hypothetical protein
VEYFSSLELIFTDALNFIVLKGVISGISRIENLEK